MKKDRNGVKDEFYVRVPYFPLNTYKIALDKGKELKKFLQENYLENLLCHSYSYYNLIKEIDNDLKIDITNTKYLIRSTYRTTPFGLSSAVLEGKFLNCNENKVIKSKFKKILRPDYEWICSLISDLELDLKENLLIKKGVFYDENVFIHKLWTSCFNKETNVNQKKYINFNKSLKLIFEYMNDDNYKSISKVIDMLYKESNYKISRDFIYDYIKQLLKQEYLISNLRIPLIYQDQLSIIIERLDEYKIHLEKMKLLKEINRLIKNYNQLYVGDGENLLYQIVTLMKDLYPIDNPIHIDMYNDSKIVLSDKVKDDLEEFINFLSKWASRNNYYQFINKFKDFYGNNAVKFLDLIDDQRGLGVPKNDDKENLVLNDQIMLSFMDCIIKGEYKDIVDISYMEDDIYNCINKDVKGELACYLIQENNEKYTYIISPLAGSYDIGKSRGRFNHIIKNGNSDKDDTFFDHVELCFFPKSAHHGNVMLCDSNYDNYLELGSHTIIEGKNRIDIENVYLMVLNDKLYFINRENNHFLKFHTSNMFNIQAYPQELKFLLEISHGQDFSHLTLQKTLIHIITHLKTTTPRIMYKNFILYPKSWYIPIKLFDKNESKKSFQYFLNEIELLIDKLKIPEYIVAGALDQKLLLYTKKENHLKILYNMIDNNDGIRVEENIFDNNLIIQDKYNNSYVGEFIFDFDLTLHKMKARKLDVNYINYQYISQNKSMFCDQWLSMKIYINEKLMNQFIVEELSTFIEYMCQSNICQNYYYLRYRDPKSHIRLRLSGNTAEIMKRVNKFIMKQKIKGNIYDFIIDSYDPEIHRYGGEKCIKYAEKFFEWSTNDAIYRLKLYIKNSQKFDLNFLFLESAMKIYQIFTVDFFEIEKFLEGYKLDREKINLYNKYKNDLKELISDKNNLNILIDKNYIHSLNLYSNLIQDKNIDKKKEIVNSLIHMSFNRLIGVNRKLESDLMGVLSRYIYSMNARKKYEEKCEK